MEYTTGHMKRTVKTARSSNVSAMSFQRKWACGRSTSFSEKCEERKNKKLRGTSPYHPVPIPVLQSLQQELTRS